MPDVKTPRWRLLPRIDIFPGLNGAGAGTGDYLGDGGTSYAHGTPYSPWDRPTAESWDPPSPQLYKEPDV